MPQIKINVDDLSVMKWAESHGASCDNGFGYIGTGMLYYALAYVAAKRPVNRGFVCLGSGSGFVPLIMRNAVHDAGRPESIHLVDSNSGEWGLPVYGDTFNHSNIEYHNMTTQQAFPLISAKVPVIRYLHIDADHSYEGVYFDLRAYSTLVSSGGFITLHDSRPTVGKNNTPVGVTKAVKEFLCKYPFWRGVEINMGAGVWLLIRD